MITAQTFRSSTNDYVKLSEKTARIFLDSLPPEMMAQVVAMRMRGGE